MNAFADAVDEHELLESSFFGWWHTCGVAGAYYAARTSFVAPFRTAISPGLQFSSFQTVVMRTVDHPHGASLSERRPSADRQ